LHASSALVAALHGAQAPLTHSGFSGGQAVHVDVRSTPARSTPARSGSTTGRSLALVEHWRATRSHVPPFGHAIVASQYAPLFFSQPASASVTASASAAASAAARLDARIKISPTPRAPRRPRAARRRARTCAP